MSGASPVSGPPARAGEKRQQGRSEASRPEPPHSPARPSADPVLAPPHSPHGCVHPHTSRGQPRLLSPACALGHRRDGADTGVAESGARATARGSTSVLGTAGHPLPPCPSCPCCSHGAPGRGGTVVEQPLPCSPQKEPRWREAASARSQRRGQGCLPPSLLPSLHLSLPFSLGSQPFLPALTSPQTVVLGQRLRGETRPFACSWAGTRAVGFGPPCLAGGFSPSANPRRPASLPLPRRGQCWASEMEAAAWVPLLRDAAWPLAPGSSRDGGTLGFSWVLFGLRPLSPQRSDPQAGGRSGTLS